MLAQASKQEQRGRQMVPSHSLSAGRGPGALPLQKFALSWRQRGCLLCSHMPISARSASRCRPHWRRRLHRPGGEAARGCDLHKIQLPGLLEPAVGGAHGGSGLGGSWHQALHQRRSKEQPEMSLQTGICRLPAPQGAGAPSQSAASRCSKTSSDTEQTQTSALPCGGRTSVSSSVMCCS